MDDKFWKKFSTQIWQKKPAAFAKIDSPLRSLDADRLFQMLVTYADLCRKSNEVGGFKLFVEGIRQYDDETLQLLPEKKDKSLTGYHRRMEKHFADYCLVCDELLQVSQESWELLSQFTHDLYKHVGFPNRFSEIGLYLGNYQKTPFGVHVDSCGVFSFPAVGTKKFRIWKDSFVKKNPDLIEAHQYDKFKKNSQVLTAQPGDMTYWPSQAWHIAESDGSFSATWSLGVWVDRPHQKVIAEAMTDFLEEALGLNAQLGLVPFKDLHQPTGKVGSLPPLYRKTQAALEKLDRQGLEDLLLQNWIGLVSKQGLKTFPRLPSPPRLSRSATVKLRMKIPILWTPLKASKQLCIAFGGHTRRHLASPPLVRLLEDLNLGKSCALSTYLKGSRAAQDFKILHWLHAEGALISRQ